MSTGSEADSVEIEWWRYPTNVENFDPIAIDTASSLGHIDRLSDVVFSKGSRLEVLELSEALGLMNKTLESEDALDNFMSSKLDPPILQIVYVHSRDWSHNM